MWQLSHVQYVSIPVGLENCGIKYSIVYLAANLTISHDHSRPE